MFSLPAWAQSTPEVVVVTGQTLPLAQVGQLDKTGTPLADIPRSIEVVPRDVFAAQGATQLNQTLRDVSGATQGGQFDFGFFDRFILRGLNATFLDDGLPEGTSDLTGFVHSLNGVERVEVLKGPGSALFGSTEEGGTINLVHYLPRDYFGAGLSEQYGSFGATTTDLFVTGPSGIAGLDGRVDGEFQHVDGYRGLASQSGDLSASLAFHAGAHDLDLRLEYDNLQAVPDAEGIPFSPPSGTGDPLDVPNSYRYYTPYAFADQEIARAFLTDLWTIDPDLVVNLRAAFGARNVDLARNSGGSLTSIAGLYELAKRQLREQHDNVDDFTFQAEPRWTFDTGPVKHVFLTGVEAREINAGTERETADLPNIANVFAPVVTDGPLSSLTFKCDSSHSCNNARLLAQFYGVYAVDQIDLTDRLKIRLSARQDWFDTEAEARTSNVPANGGQEEPCVPPAATACPLLPGAPALRRDALASWDEGLVYVIVPGLSAYGGYSSAAYPIFNTEEPESVGQTPERGDQVEAGLRYDAQSWLSLSSSLYRVTRANVFTLLTVPNPTGPGDIDIPQVFSYRVKGWETDVNMRPLEDVSVLANFTVQTPDITSYPQTPADIGRAVPSVPSTLANLWASYTLPLFAETGRPTLSLGLRYRDHEFADAANTRLLPGVPLFDAAASLPFDRWILQAGVSNIADRRNYVDAAGTGGGAVPGLPRTFFVKLGVSTN